MSCEQHCQTLPTKPLSLANMAEILMTEIFFYFKGITITISGTLGILENDYLGLLTPKRPAKSQCQQMQTTDWHFG